jgi:hypothetical protein
VSPAIFLYPASGGPLTAAFCLNALLGLPDPITNRIGLKSYLRLSELLVRLFLITSSDVPTHFPPGEQPAERLNLR